MADLIDVISNEDLLRYSAKKSSMVKVGDAVSQSEERVYSPDQNDKFFLLGGAQKNDPEEKTVLSKFEYDCHAKLPFLGKLGSIGENGKFPHLAEYASIPSSIPEDKKVECFGPNHDKEVSISDSTYLSIGPSALTPSTNPGPECDARIFAKEIHVKNGSVSFPNLERIEAGNVAFHQDKSNAFYYDGTKVHIYPSDYKRKINILPARKDFDREESSSASSQDVAHSDQTRICVHSVIKRSNQSQYSTDDFSNLIQKK